MKNKTDLFKPILNRNEGFTLIEILVVVAIIAMIGTFVTGKVISRFEGAKVSGTKTQMRQLGSVLDQFKLDCNTYPTSEQGLNALVSKPDGLDCPNYSSSGYVNKIPKDAFGKAFDYKFSGGTYEIISFGADGQPGGEGANADISSKNLD